jgi:hypothetical protein
MDIRPSEFKYGKIRQKRRRNGNFEVEPAHEKLRITGVNSNERKE